MDGGKVAGKDPGLVALLATVISLGCSGDPGASHGSAGTGASANQAGAGVAAQGGGAGKPTLGGSGGTAAGSGGSGPGSVATVFDPTLTPPAYDCRTDVESKACLSVSGTLNGVAFDRHCAMPGSPGLLRRSPDAWPVACFEDPSDKVGYFFQVSVPVQPPGVFNVTVALGSTYTGADVVAAKDDQGGDFRSDHLIAGALAATIEVDPVTSDHLIVGTFRASWGVPEVDCDSYFPNDCLPAQVHGNFRVDHYLKP